MKNTWMRRGRIGTGLLAGCALIAACGQTGGSPSGEGGSEAPIQVGVAQPLTGPVAEAGQSVTKGVQIAAKEINEKGGINGHPIELVVEDNANDPATCSSVAQKLGYKERVPVIIGFWGSSCTLAAIPVLKRAGIPLVVETSGAGAITDPNQAWNPMVFRLAPTGSQEAAALGQTLVEELDTESFFQLAVNNDFGRSFTNAYSKELTQLGAEDLGSAYFDQSAQRFDSYVTKAKQSGADTIILVADVSKIAPILGEMETQGVDAQVLTSGGSNSPNAVIELAGERAAEGHYAAAYFPYFDPSLAAAQEKAKEFVNEWKGEPSALQEAARGYDAVYTVADALKRADDPTNPEAIAKALRSAKLQGIMFGDIQFEQWGALRQQNVQPMYLVQVQDGKIEVAADVQPPYSPPK